MFLVTAPEFVDTPGGIHQFHLACVKGVGCMGDLQFDQGVFLSIFPDDGLPALGGGFGKEAIIVRHVFKDHEAVFFRMNVLFHFSLIAKNQGAKIDIFR
jgi:hypothetical protein